MTDYLRALAHAVFVVRRHTVAEAFMLAIVAAAVGFLIGRME